MPSKPFDVFLSHNSRDKPEAHELYFALKDQGLKPWLDEEELQPGLSWLRRVRKSPEQLSGGSSVGWLTWL